MTAAFEVRLKQIFTILFIQADALVSHNDVDMVAIAFRLSGLSNGDFNLLTRLRKFDRVTDQVYNNLLCSRDINQEQEVSHLELQLELDLLLIGLHLKQFANWIQHILFELFVFKSRLQTLLLQKTLV